MHPCNQNNALFRGFRARLAENPGAGSGSSDESDQGTDDSIDMNQEAASELSDAAVDTVVTDNGYPLPARLAVLDASLQWNDRPDFPEPAYNLWAAAMRRAPNECDRRLHKPRGQAVRGRRFNTISSRIARK